MAGDKAEFEGRRKVLGNCPLCRDTDVELQNSHIIPAWAYRRAKGPPTAKGPSHPVIVERGVAVQTSKQHREHMLCGGCEGRLGTSEDYVKRIAGQDDGTLGLWTVLPGAPMLEMTPPLFGIMRAFVDISGLDRVAIAKFAASVFWRAHVARRPKIEGLRMWNSHAESLRRFVHEDRPLPSRMCLMSCVLIDERDQLAAAFSNTLAFPSTIRRGESAVHFFVVAGLAFILFTDKPMQSTCIACAPAPIFLFSRWERFRPITNLADAVRDAVSKVKK